MSTPPKSLEVQRHAESKEERAEGQAEWIAARDYGGRKWYGAYRRLIPRTIETIYRCGKDESTGSRYDRRRRNVS
jgi:hypothetical protein